MHKEEFQYSFLKNTDFQQLELSEFHFVKLKLL